jgi:epoxyqueuosine reductase
VPVRPEDRLPGLATVLMLSPDEPGFWAHATAAPEFADGAPDPLDRWSTRVIGALAAAFDAVPLFPFGAPARPFVSWALRSGRAWLSPATLLVHDRMGLMASWRGALAVREAVPPAAAAASPCATCVGRPCLTTCPPRALTEARYDLAACHAFLGTGAGAGCRTAGCAVRRACPLSVAYGRLREQSAHHMGYFHR